MIIEVREDFKKEFNRKLENCIAQVRCKLKGNTSANLRWSEPDELFGLLRV